MLFFYSLVHLTFDIVYDINVRGGLYIGLGFAAAIYGIELNKDIKRKTGNKNLFFIFFVFIMAIVMYLYYFDKYNIEILQKENWEFLLPFTVFIGTEILYYNKTAEEIEKIHNGDWYK